jgi:hypothetical protein
MHTKINQWLTSVALVLGIVIMGAVVYFGLNAYAALAQLTNPDGAVAESDYSTGDVGGGDVPSMYEQYPDSWYLDGEGNECWDPGSGRIVCAPYGG